NIIVARIVNNSGKGGFVLDKPYELKVGNHVVDLKGDWKMKPGCTMPPLEGETFIRWKPMGLYNAMIAPLLNYAIKGTIWYQGESNTGKPDEYAKLFPALILGWRKNFEQGDFPFLFVQLPNFMESKSQPSESNWAETRESQLKTLSVPNTAMVVTIDIGEWNDIHPLDKQDVGNRLALAAQKLAYNDSKVVYSGPLYKSMKVTDRKIELTFSQIGSGLEAKGQIELNGFAIAGADRKFVWAKAEIKNNKVIVWNNEVQSPVLVRYAWADNPDGANLFNKDGLPASPFTAELK
ncbi:MAG: sialate O-acetylesterase, partial [Paludibacter sp.]